VSNPARPARPGDLVELAGPQHALLAPVVLGQRGEQHRADRYVDPDAEGVRAADDREQPALGQGLDEAAVLGQHPRVVDADAVQDEPAQRLAEPLAEPEPADGLLDGGLAGRGDDVDAHQRLRLLDRR
jgi:hypothetical protein